MEQELHKLKCEACTVGASPLLESEISDLLSSAHGWELFQEDSIKKLKRQFKFRNFSEALEFTNKVGFIAEENGHHPSLLTEWGSVTVTYWTHKIKGLHKSDFIMASKTNKLYGE